MATPTPEEPRFFSETTLAEFFDMEAATLRQWRWQGRGPRWIKVGGRVRYDRRDVEAWLLTQKSGSGAA